MVQELYLCYMGRVKKSFDSPFGIVSISLDGAFEIKEIKEVKDLILTDEALWSMFDLFYIPKEYQEAYCKIRRVDKHTARMINAYFSNND